MAGGMNQGDGERYTVGKGVVSKTVEASTLSERRNHSSILSGGVTWFDICFKRINHSGCCIENEMQRGKANIDRNVKFGNYLIPWLSGRTRWDISPLIPLTPTSALLSQLIISLFRHSLAIIFWNMTRWAYHGRLVMDNSPGPLVSVNCPPSFLSHIFMGANTFG